MSAFEHLNGMQFKAYSLHNIDPREYDMVRVFEPGSSTGGHPDTPQVGWMQVDKDKSIAGVWTRPDMRRKGVATAMLDYAQHSFGDVHHSDERTDSGEAWAKSFGAVPRKVKGRWHDHSQMYAG